MSTHAPPPTSGDGPTAHPRALIAISVIVLVGALAAFAITIRSHDASPPKVQFQPAGATGTATPAGTPTGAGAGTTAAAASTTTTPGQGLTAAILAGYRAEVAAFYAAASRYPVDPSDPALAATMTGSELTAVQNRLTIARHQGQYGVGTADLAPVLDSIGPGATTATISDCLADHSRIVYGPTGATVSGPDTGRTLEHVTMQLDSGVWKVAAKVKASAGCIPGDK